MRHELWISAGKRVTVFLSRFEVESRKNHQSRRWGEGLLSHQTALPTDAI